MVLSCTALERCYLALIHLYLCYRFVLGDDENKPPGSPAGTLISVSVPGYLVIIFGRKMCPYTPTSAGIMRRVSGRNVLS